MHGPQQSARASLTARAAFAVLCASCGEPTQSENTNSTATTPGPVDRAVSTTPAVLVGAGDIAGCNLGYKDEYTARILDTIPGTVFTLGDNAYPDGTTSNFKCYHASWGLHKWRTRPAPGNHEYHVSGATPYFTYFGSRAGPWGRGYYSYTLGAWHIVALNSERNLTAQATWLKADLAAHRAKCTLAYWHKPLFTSGTHGSASQMRPLFKILYDERADVVVGGHDHTYERFYFQDPYGRADAAKGIRQFVVGTGGAGLYNFLTPKPNSQVRFKGYGVLRFKLYPDRYEFRFIPTSGPFKDAGMAYCH